MSVKFNIRLLRLRYLTRGLNYSIRVIYFQIIQFALHSTSRKIVNFLASKAQKWLKRDRVWGMPFRYVIDPLNFCNLRCPLCPTGLGTLGRERGKMPLERFQELINQIAPYAYLVEMYNWGEPFLHSNIFEMIQYATSRRIAVRLSSNMNYFTREMAARTISSGLDAINISVDGITQESYEKYRRRGNLNKVIEHIRFLVEEKRKQRSFTPFITLRVLANRHNENEIEAMRKLATELGVDAFTVAPIFIDTTDPIQVKEWLPENESLSYYDYSAEKMENVWHCSDLWESMTINWDGGLAPCCWLHQKKHDYTNAFDYSLKTIWNGPEYVSSRRTFAFGGPKPGSVQTICNICKGRPLYLKD